MQTANDYITCRVNSVDLKNRLGDIETDCRDRLHIWLLRIVGALTAPTSMALPCRWRSRPQHQKQALLGRFCASALGLRRLSCGRTTRRFPKLCGCCLPIKRVIAWTMMLQMFHARDSLLDAGPMAGRHPPQHDGWPFKMLKPIGAAAIEAFMDRLPDKALKCIYALPNGKIDDNTRVGIRARVSGIAAIIDIAPDEPGAAFGNAVHQCKIVREICHARIFNLVSNAADVQLCKMMIGWLLQGPTPSAISVAIERRYQDAPTRFAPQSRGREVNVEIIVERRAVRRRAPTVLSIETLAHHGRTSRPLHCGISVPSMSGLGH
jgi:hypothetical protein